jgi:hypothetical protein
MPSTRWSMSMPPGARYAEPDQPGAVPVHERPERPGLPARTRHDPNPPDGAAAPISMDKVGRRNYADNNRGADGAVGLSARTSAAVGAAITSGAACRWSSTAKCPFRAKRHCPADVGMPGPASMELIAPLVEGPDKTMIESLVSQLPDRGDTRPPGLSLRARPGSRTSRPARDHGRRPHARPRRRSDPAPPRRSPEASRQRPGGK